MRNTLPVQPSVRKVLRAADLFCQTEEESGERDDGRDSHAAGKPRPERYSSACWERSRTEVRLPWPPSVLSPNNRSHWAVKSKAAKEYRQQCFAQMRANKIRVNWDGIVHLMITFFPPDLRHRDDDNMIASFKAGRDGIADALGINDRLFRIHPEVSDKTGGYVEVRFVREVSES